MTDTIALRLFKSAYDEEEDTPERIAEAEQVEAAAKQELEDGLKANEIPFEKIGWDWYDSSLELYGVPPDYRLTDAAHAFLKQCGFMKVFVNHTDLWETHYGFHSHNPNREGWRKSSPHVRNDGDPAVWLEEHPGPGWDRNEKICFAWVKTFENGVKGDIARPDYPKDRDEKFEYKIFPPTKKGPA